MMKAGTMGVHYMHRIDPAVILTTENIVLYFSCIAYAAGFLGVLFLMLRRRERLGLQRFDACEGRYVMRVMLAGILMYSLTMPALWNDGMFKQIRERISREGGAEAANYPVYDSCITSDLCLGGQRRSAGFLNGVSEKVFCSMKQVALHNLNMSAAQSLNRKF